MSLYNEDLITDAILLHIDVPRKTDSSLESTKTSQTKMSWWFIFCQSCLARELGKISRRTRSQQTTSNVTAQWTRVDRHLDVVVLLTVVECFPTFSCLDTYNRNGQRLHQSSVSAYLPQPFCFIDFDLERLPCGSSSRNCVSRSQVSYISIRISQAGWELSLAFLSCLPTQLTDVQIVIPQVPSQLFHRVSRVSWETFKLWFHRCPVNYLPG